MLLRLLPKINRLSICIFYVAENTPNSPSSSFLFCASTAYVHEVKMKTTDVSLKRPYPGLCYVF